jgi:hypothetical protein
MVPILTRVGSGDKAQPDLLADAVAELYQADPDDFTQRRTELAAQAREAGQAATAKQIAALRKPTRSAWVVNRLVRTDPEVTSRLAALSAELHAPAEPARIRELTAARGRLVDELTRQALEAVPAPPAALREEVTATFDAALADPDIAAKLGTLVRAEHWAGFGPGLVLAPDPSAVSKKPAPAEPSAPPELRRREKIIEAERAVAEADRDAAAAAVAEQQLEDTVRRLEAELAEARQQLAEARRQSYRAESRQRRAGLTLDRLRQP